MPKQPPQLTYRALTGISVRVSQDPASPNYETFMDWEAGDVMTNAPAHTNWPWLIASGHVEEVPVVEE